MIGRIEHPRSTYGPPWKTDDTLAFIFAVVIVGISIYCLLLGLDLHAAGVGDITRGHKGCLALNLGNNVSTQPFHDM